MLLVYHGKTGIEGESKFECDEAHFRVVEGGMRSLDLHRNDGNGVEVPDDDLEHPLWFKVITLK